MGVRQARPGPDDGYSLAPAVHTSHQAKGGIDFTRAHEYNENSYSIINFMQTTQPLAIEIAVDSPEMGRAVERAAIKFAALYRERHAARVGKLIDRATEFYLEIAPIPLEDDPQVERNGRARAQFLLEDRPYTAAQASKALGSRARNATELASRHKREGRLFTVRDGTTEKYPRFQFDAHGQPLPVIAQILKLFKGRLEGWEIALWFHANNGWLPQQARPADLLRRQPDAVLVAAKREVAGAEF